MLPNGGALVGFPAVRVLIVGGSYGGLAAALNLHDLARGRVARFDSNPEAKVPAYKVPIQMTIVDERDGYYHLIGSPKSLACEKFAAESWTRFQDIPALKSPYINFIQGTVSTINPAEKVAHILDTATKANRIEQYDYLIAASGLRRVFPTVPQSLRRVEFLQEAQRQSKAVTNAREGIAVVGGGAVGVEMAAELKILHPQKKITLIHSRDRLLSSEPLPNEFAERVLTVLREVGVETILGQRVIDTTAVDTETEQRMWRLTLSDGRQLIAGHVLSAISQSIPTSTYLPSEALDEDGYIKIRPSLQFAGDVPNADDHFAVGDIASWTGIKRCGGAMHMGQYAANNIHQRILSKRDGIHPAYQELSPFPSLMGLALGHKAVTYTPTDGTKDGEELLAQMFGDDMAKSSTYTTLRVQKRGATNLQFSMLELYAPERSMPDMMQLE
ncbi:hypothetical protein N7470_007069 [Penicillium chermesinum]|nr:hypothetical protein N7470_007069 [Penicillium chermesinum]